MLNIRVFILVAFLLALSPSVSAQLNPDLDAPSIVINLPSRTLELYSNNTLIKVYPLAVGKPSTPSPVGNFYVLSKEVNPWWYPPRTGLAVPSGPDNPLGYRWMEFSPMYGIHGTNAPWAIGLAVSNGCIRMPEEDVEELFEVVQYGTAVRITYDRVKVRASEDGEVSIGIYPDIYGRQDLSLEDVKYALNSSGVGEFLSDDELIRLIQEEADQQIVVAKLHSIKVNGKPLSEKAVTYKDIMYVPVWPVAKAIGIDLTWDDKEGLVRGNNQVVPGVQKGDRLFVTAEGAQILFGGQQIWEPEGNCLSFDVLSVLFNGRLISNDVRTIDGVLAIPFSSAAEATGLKLTRTSGGEYVVRGTKAPVRLIGEIPYIQITRIYDVLQADVYWNQPSRSIELTYPIKPASSK